MFIVIIGCGRTGSRLAGLLSAHDHDLVVVDKDESALSDLPVEFSGFEIVGNALNRDILEQANLESADLMVAATNDDKINFMITQLVQLKYPDTKIITRVIEPELKELYDLENINLFSEAEIFVDEIFNAIHRGGEDL